MTSIVYDTNCPFITINDPQVTLDPLKFFKILLWTKDTVKLTIL